MSGPVRPNPWTALRGLTPARIALGRAGASLPTAQVLAFGLAHAQARDAVHIPLDADALEAEARAAGWPTLRVCSQAPDRATYLLRPDLGRRVAPASAELLAAAPDQGADVLFVLADGLSATAVQHHALPVLAAVRALLPPTWKPGPLVIAEQGRVALGDEIGGLLGARLVVVLIGERPGLSSPDSLGAYLTWGPHGGRTDAERNCISNIRPEGLTYGEAARRLAWLCEAARRLGHSGVELKDGSAPAPALPMDREAQRLPTPPRD